MDKQTFMIQFILQTVGGQKDRQRPDRLIKDAEEVAKLLNLEDLEKTSVPSTPRKKLGLKGVG